MTSTLLTLLKLDFFFVFSFAAQLIPSQKLQYDETLSETVLVFVLGAIGLSLAIFAVYRESIYLMGTFIIAGVLAIVYLIYRLVRIALPRPLDADPYQFTRKFLTFTVVVTIVLIILTLAVAIQCFMNLKKGVFVYASRTDGTKNIHSLPIDQSSDEFDIMGMKPRNDNTKTLLETTEQQHSSAAGGAGAKDDMWTIE